VFLALKLIGALSLLAMSAGLVGGALGFLFGLPARAGQSGNASADGTAQGGSQSTRWLPSTNLIQITDWLTKTLVGVSLVEAKSAYQGFVTLSSAASLNLLGGMFGSGIVAPAVMIGGAILGFKLCNIYTLLYLARLIADAGTVIELLTPPQKKAVGDLAQMPSASPSIAEPIEVTPIGAEHGATTPQATAPTPEQSNAALDISQQPLANLTAYDSVLAWARARALLNDYATAAEAYRKLLRLMTLTNPDILAEAARVFAKVHAYDEAKRALSDALALMAQAPPSQRVPIVRDYVTLLLYDPKPQGYTAALQLLDDAVVQADASGELALLRACANGQKYSVEKASLGAEAAAALRTAVVTDIQTALQRGQNHGWIIYLANPDAPGKPPKGSVEREDDLEEFHSDPDFLKALGLAAPATSSSSTPQTSFPPSNP
jgi:tetratricopeptide (TPR) repeat protein